MCIRDRLGIVAAMLYPVSVFFLGLDGALYVSLALLLALIVWYEMCIRDSGWGQRVEMR